MEITVWVLRSRLFSRKWDYDKVDAIRGMNITICTSAETDESAKSLLGSFGLTFQEMIFYGRLKCRDG